MFSLFAATGLSRSLSGSNLHGAMNPQEILTDLSEAILQDAAIAESLPRDVRDSGWLGFPPCTEEEVAAAEQRLNVILPKNLREFYLLTNGWRNINPFVYAILPLEKIDLLPNLDPVLTDAIKTTAPDGSYATMLRELNSHIEVPEFDIVQFADETVTRPLRSIVLSTEGDAITTLIDPDSDIGNGEWEVGAWASWYPGMRWSGTDWWSYLSAQLDHETAG